MKTVWEYSLDSETNRLLGLLRQISSGFYRINGFHPIPLAQKLNSDSTVPIPDLPYLTIPNFWKKVNQINTDEKLQLTQPEFFSQVRNLLSNYGLPQANYQKVLEAWQSAENDVMTEIIRILPTKKDYISQIVIHPTVFGTTSSFNQIIKKSEILTIYLRHDQGIFAITESILTSLIVNDIYNDFQGLWQEAEMLTDWLVTQSSIVNILNKYSNSDSFKPTMLLVRNEQINQFKKESSAFYTKLGLHVPDNHFSIKGNNIYYAGKKLHNLNPKEIKIFESLIANKHDALHYDILGEIIYGKEIDWSLYSLSKTIERLRRKLEKNGISGSYIQTVRGFGFLLRN